MFVWKARAKWVRRIAIKEGTMKGPLANPFQGQGVKNTELYTGYTSECPWPCQTKRIPDEVINQYKTRAHV